MNQENNFSNNNGALNNNPPINNARIVSYDPNTGAPIYENLNNQNNNMPVPPNSTKIKEGLGTASLVIGIIALVLSFIFSIFILPLAIVGLVLGIVNKVKHGKKFAGIILNAISIFTAFITLFIYTFLLSGFFPYLFNELDYQTSDNYIAGKYNCTGVDDNTDTYLVTLHLNNDNTFLYGPYGNLSNNYAKGTYSYEDEHKSTSDGSYKYFMITFNGKKEDFVVDGVAQDHDFYSKMEFGITKDKGKKQGVIIFTSSYNMYYCYEE